LHPVETHFLGGGERSFLFATVFQTYTDLEGRSKTAVRGDVFGDERMRKKAGMYELNRFMQKI
jgi:hypothetical protein